MNYLVLAGFGLPFLITLAAVPVVIRLSARFELYDQPDEERKIHRGNISYMGGLALMTAFLVSMAVVDWFIFPNLGYSLNLKQENLPYFWLVVIGTWLVGMSDDFFDLRAGIRFGLQFAGAGIMILGTRTILPIGEVYGFVNAIPYGDFIFTILVFSAITNAFNLIDGMDGLASSLGLMAAFGFALLNYMEGDYYYMVIALVLAAGLAAFLFYNKPVARIFLGDNGSYLTGILLSILTVNFIANSSFPDFNAGNRFQAALALIALPSLDMTRLFFLRLIRGVSPFRPDRNHIHHILLDLGLSVPQTLLIILGLAVFILVCGFVSMPYVSFTVFGIASTGSYVFFILVLKKLTWRANAQAEAGLKKEEVVK